MWGGGCWPQLKKKKWWVIAQVGIEPWWCAITIIIIIIIICVMINCVINIGSSPTKYFRSSGLPWETVGAAGWTQDGHLQDFILFSGDFIHSYSWLINSLNQFIDGFIWFLLSFLLNNNCMLSLSLNNYYNGYLIVITNTIVIIMAIENLNAGHWIVPIGLWLLESGAPLPERWKDSGSSKLKNWKIET
jgi:hypothetical protein